MNHILLIFTNLNILVLLSYHYDPYVQYKAKEEYLYSISQLLYMRINKF